MNTTVNTTVKIKKNKKNSKKKKYRIVHNQKLLIENKPNRHYHLLMRSTNKIANQNLVKALKINQMLNLIQINLLHHCLRVSLATFAGVNMGPLVQKYISNLVRKNGICNSNRSLRRKGNHFHKSQKVGQTLEIHQEE